MEINDRVAFTRRFLPKTHRGVKFMHPKLIEILICPITAKRLRLSKDKKHLVTIDEKLAYPIIDGIPRLSPEDVIDDFKKENRI